MKKEGKNRGFCLRTAAVHYGPGAKTGLRLMGLDGLFNKVAVGITEKEEGNLVTQPDCYQQHGLLYAMP